MSVQIDVLDDILNTIRLNGTVYFQRQFKGDWGIETKATPFKKFHIIVDGRCWLRADFLQAPLQLAHGDIIAFPHGSPYRLSADVNSLCVSADELLNDLHRASRLFADGVSSATIVFGHVEFTRDFNHPFMRDLPPFIHIRGQDDDDLNALRAVANLTVTETRLQRPGAGSVVKRLAEVLHLYTLRAHVLSQQGSGSFHAAYHDPIIYRALQIIHANIAENWTLEQLAKQVNVSRTVFTTRFKELVGMAPMRYITVWRMQKARELLETSRDTIASIASAVGYSSEAALSHAFVREFHDTPGRFRQTHASHD
ncbi:MAG: AraC family transcriptional regulator [bacterium]|nr:AraC family transcriptional regulator [bacterium]